MKIIKCGGASLNDASSIRRMGALIKNEPGQKVVVVSAVAGVTDMIHAFTSHFADGSASGREKDVRELMNALKQRHQAIINESGSGSGHSGAYESVRSNLDRLERLLYGVAYTEDLTAKLRDLILSFGERFSASICESILTGEGLPTKALEADKIGVVTDGDFGNSTAIIDRTARNVRKHILPLLKRGVTPVVTGYFGADENGHTTTFGRGGSDYSAAVLAAALDAKELVVWKDVDGFLSADPKMVPHARKIDELSYDEAAELAYFGAKILHPRSIEPVMQKNIPVIIRNFSSSSKGFTRISRRGRRTQSVLKSVSYDRDLSMIKIFGAGIGYKPGVLMEIVSRLSSSGINIKSVITSQTCIDLLLAKEDAAQSVKLLAKNPIKAVDRVAPVEGIALIGIVGEGMLAERGIAARVFSSVSKIGVNVEAISAGASLVAYYFVVGEKDLAPAIKAIHREFFE